MTITSLTVKADQRVNDFRQLLNAKGYKEQIALALPRHMDPDKMLRVALTAMQRTPKLLDCDPMSIMACVMGAAELGLELTGPLGQCYMVPRYNKNLGCQAATFQVGYKGLQQLAYRSEKVVSFPARVVYAKDVFEVHLGTSQFIRHAPCLEEDPGAIVAFYAVLNLRGADPDFEVMSQAQMLAHRKRFAPDNKIWDSDYEEMGKKTVIRRLAKRAPVSTELMRAAAQDEYGEAGLDQELPSVAHTAEMTRLRVEMMKERMAGEGGSGDGVLPQASTQDHDAGPAGITDAQANGLRQHFARLGWGDGQVNVFFEKYGPPESLTREQAEAALAELQAIGPDRPKKPKS